MQTLCHALVVLLKIIVSYEGLVVHTNIISTIKYKLYQLYTSTTYIARIISYTLVLPHTSTISYALVVPHTSTISYAPVVLHTSTISYGLIHTRIIGYAVIAIKTHKGIVIIGLLLQVLLFDGHIMHHYGVNIDH